MEKIIEKLNQINDNDNKNPTKVFDDWSLEERKQLLDIYFIISKKESHIFNLIYDYHGCDSWEDIFRDYKIRYLKYKAAGVKIAIDGIMEKINAAK